MEVCIAMRPSSALLIASAIVSSEFLANLSISDRMSKIFSSSDLVVGQQRTECDRKQSSLLFHLMLSEKAAIAEQYVP